MKYLLIPLLLIISISLGYSKMPPQVNELSPEYRQSLAADWLETAKAYYTGSKADKAKSSLNYVIELYPMGQEAEEARKLLKEYFNINSPYKPDITFKNFIKSGDTETNDIYRINSYLMANIIKIDKIALYKTAKAYKKAGNTDK